MRKILTNTKVRFANSKIRLAGIGLLSILALASCQNDEEEKLLTIRDLPGAISIQYDYLVPAGTTSINGDASTADKNDFVVDVKGGTVIALEAGDYPDLNLKNIHGSAGNPVTIINYGGKVNIGTNAYSTVVKVIDCTHFRFTGSGSNDMYGISIDGSNAQRGEHTMEVYGVSSDFEIDHIEAFNSTFGGLVIKSDPKTFNPEVWRDNFEMKNISVNNNYFHDNGGEGIYIGYTGDGIEVDGGKAMPHLISGLRVNNNRVENTQWDGIQINRAYRDVQVYGNTISNYGLERNDNQNTGLDIGYETVGKFYNNYINKGDGIGIQIKGIGDISVYNNVVLNAGYDGIYANDYNAENGRDGYRLVNNTVVNAGHFGIRLVNFKSSKGNENTRDWVVNNLVAKVVGEGLGDRDYIHIAQDETKTLINSGNNLSYATTAEANFTNGYELADNAEAVDGGQDVSLLGVSIDYNWNARPQGNAYDVGAYEVGSGMMPPEEDKDPNEGTNPDDGITNPDIALTQLSSSECGRMDGKMEDMLWADAVDGATSYEFRVVNEEKSYEQTKVTTARFMKLKDFAGAEEHVIYQISVRAIVGTEKGAYGGACDFQVGGDATTTPEEEDPFLDASLPITKISANECGRLDGSKEDMIWATKVSGIDSYEFTITNSDTEESESVISTAAFVKLKNFKIAQTNVVYEIKVRTVKGEMHSAYGDTCEFQAVR